ncbi:hypothetical protein L2E82_03498 [Cichorium intybus]|uniref:Uncharacterized protein n=1 Tax=Cichorium intybus TaxID=13427 RepID=A0ACB9H5B4_CICIN|nr:hypothetical protein L2E82_03498 [Cichorium intybus]
MASDANEKRASKMKEMMKKMEEEVANLKEAIYKNTTDVNASVGVIITMLGTKHGQEIKKCLHQIQLHCTNNYVMTEMNSKIIWGTNKILECPVKIHRYTEARRSICKACSSLS